MGKGKDTTPTVQFQWGDIREPTKIQFTAITVKNSCEESRIREPIERVQKLKQS
jgi:hypothetical protein